MLRPPPYGLLLDVDVRPRQLTDCAVPPTLFPLDDQGKRELPVRRVLRQASTDPIVKPYGKMLHWIEIVYSFPVIRMNWYVELRGEPLDVDDVREIIEGSDWSIVERNARLIGLRTFWMH